MRMQSCRTVWGLLGLFATALFFSSCSNFLNGAQTKKQLEERIAYANAPSYKISVDSKKKGVIKSPAGGTIEIKVTDTFELTFDPLSDYEFLKWTIIDSNSKKEIPNGQYLTLDSITSESTNCTLTTAPDAGISLCLYPVVTKRPRVISVTPQTLDGSAYRDSRVRVIFDKPIEKKSIYYSDEEIKSLTAESGVKNFLNAGTKQNPKYYGYTLDGVTYFKNILIENQQTGNSVLQYFGAPYFEDNVTLVIPPAANSLPGNMYVSVTLENGFSYSESNKSIMLKEDYKWLYFVGTKEDNDGPLGLESLKNNKGTDISATESAPTVLGHKIQIFAKATDSGSGPNGTFKLLFTDPKDENNTHSYNISYTSTVASSAFFGVEKSESNYEYGEYTISDIPEGKYKLNLLYYDKNDAPTVSKDYFVNIDFTGPEISFSTEDQQIHDDCNIDAASVQAGKTAFQLPAYTCDDSDFERVVVKYCRSDGTEEKEKSFNKGDAVIIPMLTHGVNYSIDAYFYDTVDNFSKKHFFGVTKPGVVKNATYTVQDDGNNETLSVRLSWQAPDGYFDSYVLRDNNFNSITIEKDKTEYVIIGLNLAKTYDYRLSTQIKLSQEQSKESNSTILHIITPMPQVNISTIGTTLANYSKNIIVNSNTIASKVVDDGENDIQAYIYYDKDENNVKQGTSIIMQYRSNGFGGQIKNFDFNEQYFFAIKLTKNKNDNNDEWSDVWSEVISYTPTIPVSYFTPSEITDKSFKVSWRIPEWPFGSNGGAKLYIDGTMVHDYGMDKKEMYYVCNNLSAGTTHNVELRITWNDKTDVKSLTVTTLSQ